MRADRLVATLLLMQTKGRVTAAEVASELEVSVATARRDLEALAAAGVPVYPQAGRGGGWSLVGGARTDLTGLTGPEAEALFLLAGPGAGEVPEARVALRKLLQALPATFRTEAEAAARAVVTDPRAWGDADRDRLPMVGVLRSAVVRRRRVRLGYRGRGSEPSDRLVAPLGLADKDDVWYLIADTDAGRRTFRVDRILGATVTDDPFTAPADFDLAEEWEVVVQKMERQRSQTDATVLVDPRRVSVLQTHFGRHCRVAAPAPDGRATVVVAAPTPLMIAQQLAGWGSGIEVVGPPSVQAELARIGAELTGRYAAGGPRP